MRIGLCLAGGGAKGAYQAGVICGLYEQGIKEFKAISGTSIGSINGYFVYTNNVNKLKDVWTNIEEQSENGVQIINNTVDNSNVINILTNLDKSSTQNAPFYVNYVNINGSRINEITVDISNLDEEKGLESVKYSSLLPCNIENKGQSLNFKETFMRDLQTGMYDGYSLDGGLVTNTLLSPLFQENLDKIVVITNRHDYELPEYVKMQINPNKIVIIKPKTVFKSTDTLNFNDQFCTEIFEEGYKIGRNTNIFM